MERLGAGSAHQNTTISMDFYHWMPSSAGAEIGLTAGSGDGEPKGEPADWWVARAAVTAFNGYGVAEAETIWLNNSSAPVTIPAGGSASLGYYIGDGPVRACAGLDSVQIVCGNL